MTMQLRYLSFSLELLEAIFFQCNFSFRTNTHTTSRYSTKCDTYKIKTLLVLFITDGRCLLANLKTKTVLHHFNFKKPVFDIKFSPCGK